MNSLTETELDALQLLEVGSESASKRVHKASNHNIYVDILKVGEPLPLNVMEWLHGMEDYEMYGYLVKGYIECQSSDEILLDAIHSLTKMKQFIDE